MPEPGGGGGGDLTANLNACPVSPERRKSTHKGLEQEFNSLEAQRAACLAYIQRQPGWTIINERYDDGGFTGANTDRPAFQRLMEDVEGGKVDIIVVYKVDRLSRSLLDFAKVMERFDDAGAPSRTCCTARSTRAS